MAPNITSFVLSGIRVILHRIHSQACMFVRIPDLKTKGMGFASFLREKTVAASSSFKKGTVERDWSAQGSTLANVRTATGR